MTPASRGHPLHGCHVFLVTLCGRKLSERAPTTLQEMRWRNEQDDTGLLQLGDELLLKIIDSMTTTEGRGLLASCRHLSRLTLPRCFKKRQKEVRILFGIYPRRWREPARAQIDAGCWACGFCFR